MRLVPIQGPRWLPLALGLAWLTTCGYAQQPAVVADSVVNSPSPDSLNAWRDSLEVALLRTTQTYQHVERLLRSLPPGSPRLALIPSVLPVDLPIQAFQITSPFGYRRHPIHQQLRFHGGVDVKAPLGMPVKATAAGIVEQVGYDPALGAFVRVQHAFGFETTYGHLTGYCVQPGQLIARNQELGRVGQTGLATGPHLHYVIKKNGSAVDPYHFCFLLRKRLYQVNSSVSGRPGPSPSPGKPNGFSSRVP